MRQVFSFLQYGGKKRKMARRRVVRFVNRKKEEMVSGCFRLSQMQDFIVPK